MTPGAGTPFRVASTIRIHSMRRPGARAPACTPLALLFTSIVLAGCAFQPPMQDASPSDVDADVVSDDVLPGVAGNVPRSPSTSAAPPERPAPTVAEGIRPPARTEPAGVAILGGDSATTPTQPGSGKDTAGSPDTWARIRAGLSLPRPAHPRVMRAADWYGSHQKYLHRMTQRAYPYLAYIVREVERRGLPMEFALLPVVESAFRVFAKSSAGAAGLWQFIPATGKRYGLEQNRWYDGRRDVVESTRAALDYLTKLLEDFHGDRLLAVAAYNWGEGNVRRAIARNRARGKPVDVWSLRLPKETRAHVSRLLAIAAVVEDPDRYGVVLASIPDRVYFQQVTLHDQVDLGVAAGLAGITLDEIRRLNPGFKRRVTGPRGPHRLQLPSHAVKRFRTKLAELSVRSRMRWAHYEIMRGDTLSIIADRYGTSVAALKQFNGLASDRIFAGQDLMVPVAAGTPAPATSPATVHVVQRGDTLSAIARRHGTTVLKLTEFNRIHANAILHPGQRLRVIPAVYTTPPGGGGSVRYRVKSGDTLWRISRRFGVSVASLRKWNRLSRDDLLMPGRELDVHLTHAPAI